MDHEHARYLLTELELASHIPDISSFNMAEEKARVKRLEYTLDKLLTKYLNAHANPYIIVPKRHRDNMDGKWKWFDARKHAGPTVSYFLDGLWVFRRQYGIMEPAQSLEHIAKNHDPPEDISNAQAFYERRLKRLQNGSFFVKELLRQNHKEAIWYGTVVSINTTRADFEFSPDLMTKCA